MARYLEVICTVVLLCSLLSITSAVSMIEVIACDYYGMTVEIIRDPVSHKGVPYIDGYKNNKECPQLQPGPDSNTWYYSWTLRQLLGGLCGEVKGMNFSTHIILNACDCELITAKDLKALVGCNVIGFDAKQLRSGHTPDNTDITLITQADVSNKGNDYVLDKTVDPPLLSGIVRDALGFPVSVEDDIEIGQDLDFLLQMTEDRFAYWGSLSIVDMTARPLGVNPRSLKYDFIKSMCLGAAIREEYTGPPGLLIAADKLKACDKCADVIDRLGIIYDATVIHGKSVKVPFKMSVFHEDPDGLELDFRVMACASRSPTECARSDCPALPSGRTQRFMAVPQVDHSRRARLPRRAVPRTANYQIKFRLKTNVTNISNVNDSFIIDRHLMTTTATSKPILMMTTTACPMPRNETTTSLTWAQQHYTFIIELCLIVAGMLVLLALILPSIYVLYRYYMEKLLQEDDKVNIMDETGDTDTSDSSLVLLSHSNTIPKSPVKTSSIRSSHRIPSLMRSQPGAHGDVPTLSDCNCPSDSCDCVQLPIRSILKEPKASFIHNGGFIEDSRNKEVPQNTNTLAESLEQKINKLYQRVLVTKAPINLTGPSYDLFRSPDKCEDLQHIDSSTSPTFPIIFNDKIPKTLRNTATSPRFPQTSTTTSSAASRIVTTSPKMSLQSASVQCIRRCSCDETPGTSTMSPTKMCLYCQNKL